MNLTARVTALQRLVTQVNGATHLSASDRAALLEDLNGVELPGIEALEPQADAADTCSAVRAVAHQMVFNFRVYLLMTPQTHMTIVADQETYIESELTGLEPRISQGIRNAQAKGENVGAIQSYFDNLESQVASAQSETNGLAATLLAQAPPDYPGDRQVLLDARTSEINARNDLEAAKKDVDEIADLSH